MHKDVQNRVIVHKSAYYVLQLCKMLNTDSGPVQKFFNLMALKS